MFNWFVTVIWFGGVYKFSLLPGLRQPCRDPHRGGVHRVLRQWSHLQVGQVGHRGHREIFGRRSQWGKVQALCWRDVVVPTFWRWKKWKNINLLLTVWWLILFFFPIHFEKPATIGWLFNKKKVLYIFPGKKNNSACSVRKKQVVNSSICCSGELGLANHNGDM